MIRNLVFISIAIFSALHIRAQERNIVDGMHRVLDRKDFTDFQNHIKTLDGANWKSLRDLTTGFKEGVLFFGYIVKDKDNPAMGTDYNFRVNLITAGSRIIYYELSEEKYRKAGENWEPYFTTIDKFKDNTGYDLLKKSFRSVFHANLNESELFITDFVYGERCGFSGSDPGGRKNIDALVRNSNRAELLKWLRSTNTEKQIYAVDGLHQLKILGTELTLQELKMIKAVIGKDGSMQVCGGCIFSTQQIDDVTKVFQF